MLTEAVGLKKAGVPRNAGDTGIDVALGLGLGVLLNDAWEIMQGPGYYVDAGRIGNVGIGWDDIFQGLVIPTIIAVLPVPGAPAIALGITTATVATKGAEQSGYKLQIIPHEALPPVMPQSQFNIMDRIRGTHEQAMGFLGMRQNIMERNKGTHEDAYGHFARTRKDHETSYRGSVKFSS